MKNHPAPWSKSLIIISSLATLVCAGIALAPVLTDRDALNWVTLSPLALIVVSALFTIRGYSVTPEVILVRRLLWTTRLPVTGLQSARFEPDAICGSIRIFGNGGLFSFTGFYRNKALGSYRAFATDLHRTVVLRYPLRTIVVTPASPEDFIRDLGVTNDAA